MADGSGQAKSTGYTPPITAGKGSASALPKSTAGKKALPVLTNAPTPDVSSNSAVEVSASDILAVQVLMGDFRAAKAQMPKSWQASSNGKIYWCIEIPGHALKILNGNLYIDGTPVDALLEKLLANGKE